MTVARPYQHHKILSAIKFLVELKLRHGMFSVLQISRRLKQHHHIEKLDDVRVIRDRQTSTFELDI